MDRVLLIDGDERFCRKVADYMGRRGWRSMSAPTVPLGVEAMGRYRPQLVLAEAAPPGEFSILEAVREQPDYVPVVVMREWLSPEFIISAVARGAYDCLVKPVNEGALDVLMGRLEQEHRPALRCRAEEWEDAGEEMAGSGCPALIEELKTAGAVAATEATVLVCGESGTGKELLARAIHAASGRQGPFVAINCAAVAESLAESELFGHERGAFTGALERRPGCFEQAIGGTLFLDEIGDAPLGFQAKLLRVLDRGEFYRVGGQQMVTADVRVVAATNGDLEEMVGDGRFRRDLYYRLSEIEVRLPPLRERREDIPHLIRRLILRINRRLDRRITGVSEEVLEQMMFYDWPGNIRELQNVISRAASRCRGETILPGHLVGFGGARKLGRGRRIRSLVEVERDHIARVLKITGWNRGRSCELLGISRPTLRRKTRQFKLQKTEPAEERPESA